MSYADVSKLKDIILKNQYVLSGATNSIDWGMYTTGIFQAIEEANTADVAPIRHGEWIMKPDPYGFFEEIPVCSACGCTTKMRETYNFCPNCGAKMDLEAKENDT